MDADLEDVATRPCPRCREPVALVSVVGPTEGIVAPCGCRVPPALLERD